ncbi:hypothetical protein C8D92_10698 [Tamilnaduibacter salinus]|uniref:PhoD-like phosphatase n=1 Tax=Tamilnaduibacter salinus TaxID=1484056 RepID=A0A2U1CW15_9GAMM|nr:alkaline phosphatase family protein [Tamilnaduibacter salinus]PVY75838.1 hypothetical protein C8D92_10698 [Tamilnaduibacter salinus]
MTDPASVDIGDSLPPVITGPILRELTPDRMTLWLVTTRPLKLRVRVTGADGRELLDQRLEHAPEKALPIGRSAFVQQITVSPDTPFPTDQCLHWDLGLLGEPAAWIADWAPHLCHEGQSSPTMVVSQRIRQILHGSCRRPHHDSDDGLCRVDATIREKGPDSADRPAMLLMTGDQIYADDVAGPVLHAIQQLIRRLGLFGESLEGAIVEDSDALMAHEHSLYGRQRLLPDSRPNQTMIQQVFGGVRKPIFTSDHAWNHLATFSEVMAMYLLCWSPVPWRLIDMTAPELPADESAHYRREAPIVHQFVTGLPEAARAMAHLPVYMIFDDHDVTDDWNLSAAWEETAYGHPFSRRIIGNALLAYLLCQAWGNAPERVRPLIDGVRSLLDQVNDGWLPSTDQNHMIDRLLRFEQWHYTLPTSPRIVVLDTRTRRWRSEIDPSRPSGLLDWEALTEFQQDMLDQEAVIVVSPAPMFGVKLIEAIQKAFTFLGQPLTVDAENWMAHRGAASVLLNIFGHRRTPRYFTILSGDVHYSFAYDIRLRRRPGGPSIWQITSSGFRNEFPHQLLEWLDRLNRWLFAPWSPLNWFTKRRRMKVMPRRPEGRDAGERLWNQAGVGLVHFQPDGQPDDIQQLGASGGGTRFHASDEREH